MACSACLLLNMGRARMKIGILMIGSLYWGCARERKRWRRERLIKANPKRVRAPIRYGRCSSSRGHTYTMVFSAGMEKERFGQAIVLPCRQPATTVDDLIEEARHLWSAERKVERTKGICASWGCVALLPNPRRDLPQGVLAEWKAHVTDKCRYPRLEHVEGEPAAVSESGILNICWPQLPDGTHLEFDALLGTATEPTIKNNDYPSAQTIARAWNEAEDKTQVKYFCKNVSNGITTWQDEEIKRCLPCVEFS